MKLIVCRSIFFFLFVIIPVTLSAQTLTQEEIQNWAKKQIAEAEHAILTIESEACLSADFGIFDKAIEDGQVVEDFYDLNVRRMSQDVLKIEGYFKFPHRQKVSLIGKVFGEEANLKGRIGDHMCKIRAEIVNFNKLGIYRND
ncbi:hypothetical protein [Curvivirga aplysinae]|uniref:hypothetical protein n=1 Tax=Curvivirga aplysinae TaxID=2529852 RepID=UPI0012BD171C|nr:hypothetical protein [Curvivirga aplysinae]MTI10524.1 hypothetical protein [Curvivirga aplysinae]